MLVDLNFTLLCSSEFRCPIFPPLLYKYLENTAGIISESGIVISWTHLLFELAFLRMFLFISSKNQLFEADFFKN